MAVKVLHIIPTLDRGGAEKQMAMLAADLPRPEFDVRVCVLSRPGPLEKQLHSAAVPVSHCRKRLKVDPAAYWRLKNEISVFEPDIVHTWLFAANSYGRQAAKAAGVPVIIGGERCVDLWKTGPQLFVDRYLARHSWRIATNSSAVRDFYAAKGIPAEKFVVIPNGIDLPDESSPSPHGSHQNARGQLLDELNLPHDRHLIGCISRLWPQKRIKDAIWAADLLKRIRDDVHLLIIGDGPLRWRLERFRDQTLIQDRVHFLGVRDDVPRLLPQFSALWLTSGYEGQSNAILEAMAAGVPVVATDIPGNRDLVVSETTGYLIPVGDRAGFARWTNVLLDDAHLRTTLGEAGRQRVRAQFSRQQMVHAYAQLYREATRTVK